MGHKGDYGSPTELLKMLHLTLLFLSLLALLKEHRAICSKLVDSFLGRPMLSMAHHCSCVSAGPTKRETLIGNLFGYMINSVLLRTIIR